MPLPRIDPAEYDRQLAAKAARFIDAFRPFDLPAPAVYPSPPTHYRLRAEFRIWQRDDRVDYAMFDPAAPKTPVLIEDFPAASKSIARAMPRLREAVDADPVLRKRLFQAEFLSTLSGELLITLVYHRRLDDPWEAAARLLGGALDASIVGRSRGQKIVVGRDWVEERFGLDGRALRYRQIEGSFSQPNGEVNRAMLAWARAQAAKSRGDLLELYCGNGNFTVALAPLFRRVLATEVSKSSVRAAQENLANNGIDNVALLRMSSEEFVAARAGVREFRRLQAIDLAAYRFGTLFVDPPRSGLDAGTLALAREFSDVLYISCNPESLRENLAALFPTHRIAAAAVFDQFPYTQHLECGLRLARR